MVRANSMPAALNRIFVLTGSGISAESGIPTFRGREGYWRNFDPTKLATTAAFIHDPVTVWEWYRERRERIAGSSPNAAHIALVESAAAADEFLLVTQNVDDLHSRAEWKGRRLDPAQIVQIHGDIFATRCSNCHFRRRNPAEDVGEVPKCPVCGASLRPDVVWFDEELDPGKVRTIQSYLAKGDCDFVLVIGTTAVFSYIKEWAVSARGANGRLIEINPDETELSPLADERIRAPAATVAGTLAQGLMRRGKVEGASL